MILFILSMANFCHAQNLVPNYSFELYDTCPNNGGQLNYASFWQNPTNASPDYFNSCNAISYSVPNNICGTQVAKHGASYSGYGAYISSSQVNQREYLQIKLTAALVASSCYKLEFFVSIGDNFPYGVNTVSAFFSDTAIRDSSCLGCPLLVTPQFIYNSPGNVLGDKTGWTKVEGQFMASGGEEYMTIGNFKLDSNTVVTFVSAGVYPEGAYYYIDSISLTPTICDSSVAISENILDKNYKIYPNPAQALINIEFEKAFSENYTISIVNVLGQTVYSKQTNDSKLQISVDEFSSGIYLVKLQSEKGLWSRKFVKQ